MDGAHEIAHEGRRGGVDPMQALQVRVLDLRRGLAVVADEGARDPLAADLPEALSRLLAVGAGHHSQPMSPEVVEKGDPPLAQLPEPGQGFGHCPEVLRLVRARHEAQQEIGRPSRLGEGEPDQVVDASGPHEPGWISR